MSDKLKDSSKSDFNSSGKIFYKYTSAHQEHAIDPVIELHTFFWVKNTSKGCWIRSEHNDITKWISSDPNSIKKYAHPTKKEAWKAFMTSKKRRKNVNNPLQTNYGGNTMRDTMESVVAENPREKYLAIDSAILSLGRVVERTQNILIRITEGSVPKGVSGQPVAERDIPTLSEVIEKGPMEIEEKCKIMNELLDRIQSTFF